MTISSKKLAVLLLFILVTTPPITAEIQSETPAPSPTPSPLNETCSLYSMLFAKCAPQLSFVFLGLSLYYLIFLANWISVCFKIKQSYRKIHFLMGGLILMKAATLIYKYYEYETVIVTGIHGSDLFFYIYQFIRVLQLSIVLHLIVSGWYFVQPFIQPVDEVVLLFLIPFQFFANIAYMVIGEGDWKNLNDMLILVNLITSSLLLLPLSSSMMSKYNGTLSGIRWFYTIVMMKMLFMGFARLARNNYSIQQLNAIDVDKDLLSSNIMLEMMNLVCYMSIFDFFRRHFDDPNLSIRVK